MKDRAPDAQPIDSIREMLEDAEIKESFWTKRYDEYSASAFNAGMQRRYWELEADRLAEWLQIREAKNEQGNL